MKFLNLSSLFILIILISSCHSTEVSLRGSKVQDLALSEQDIETDASTFTNFKKEEAALLKTETTPFQEVLPPIAQYTPSVLKHKETQISPKDENTQITLTSSKTAGFKQQHSHFRPQAKASKTSKHPSKGVFGSVGHSFGVVGIVFIFVGLILFLIGGLIIDTLGALFLGFGLVFLLIWLVFAVLQGLFDVIL